MHSTNLNCVSGSWVWEKKKERKYILTETARTPDDSFSISATSCGSNHWVHRHIRGVIKNSALQIELLNFCPSSLSIYSVACGENICKVYVMGSLFILISIFFKALYHCVMSICVEICASVSGCAYPAVKLYNYSPQHESWKPMQNEISYRNLLWNRSSE